MSNNKEINILDNSNDGDSDKLKFKRLNDFGRENWKQKKLGYFIIKE